MNKNDGSPSKIDTVSQPGSSLHLQQVIVKSKCPAVPILNGACLSKLSTISGFKPDALLGRAGVSGCFHFKTYHYIRFTGGLHSTQLTLVRVRQS